MPGVPTWHIKFHRIRLPRQSQYSWCGGNCSELLTHVRAFQVPTGQEELDRKRAVTAETRRMVVAATICPILCYGCWRNSDLLGVRLFVVAPTWGTTAQGGVQNARNTISQQ